MLVQCKFGRVEKVTTLFIYRGGARHFHLGGPLEGPVLQQGKLLMVCVGLSEEDLKNFGGPLGGQAKFWGAVAPPGTPLAPPLFIYPSCGDWHSKGFQRVPEHLSLILHLTRPAHLHFSSLVFPAVAAYGHEKKTSSNACQSGNVYSENVRNSYEIDSVSAQRRPIYGVSE